MLVDSILPEKHIRSVMLGPQEQEPDREDAQTGIYDIHCETDDGSSLTIEMQVCPQTDFNDRMVFYSSFPFRNRVGKGSGRASLSQAQSQWFCHPNLCFYSAIIRKLR